MMLFAAGLITIDVVMRALFHINYFASLELSSYAFALATSFGMAWALIDKAHIRIDVIYTHLGRRMRSIADLIAIGSLALCVGVAIYWMSALVLNNYELGVVSNTAKQMPLVIVQTPWLMGYIWFGGVAIYLTGYGIWVLMFRRDRSVESILTPNSVASEVDAVLQTQPSSTSYASRT